MDTPDLAIASRSTQQAFAALTQIVYTADSYEEVQQAIVDTAVRMVDGCHHASIMVRSPDGRFETAAASDEIGALVDRLEREVGEGPCLDALTSEIAQFEDDLDAPDTQWPVLAREVVRRTPVRSAAGFRISSAGTKLGALNLFSDEVNGMGGGSQNQAIVIAAFASVSLVAMHDRDEARTLAAGLDSNREIGKAVGLLMAFHKVSDDEAFKLLRKASQDMNIKLAEVAREVVRHHNSGHPTLS